MKKVQFLANKRITHKMLGATVTEKGKCLQKYHDKDVLTMTLVQLCSRNWRRGGGGGVSNKDQEKSPTSSH